MSLAEDLLAQARHLAGLEPRRPKQASLRRALSTTYYAMFHVVIDDAAKLFASAPSLRAGVARSIDHKALKNAAKLVGGVHRGQTNWLDAYVEQSISSSLAGFCQTFAELQDQRLSADYDISAAFSRVQVILRVDAATYALNDWIAERGSHNAQVFLLASVGLLRPR